MAGLDDILARAAMAGAKPAEALPVDGVSVPGDPKSNLSAPNGGGVPNNLPGVDGGRSIDRTDLHTNFMQRLDQIGKDLDADADVHDKINEIELDLEAWHAERIVEIQALLGQAHDVPFTMGSLQLDADGNLAHVERDTRDVDGKPLTGTVKAKQLRTTAELHRRIADIQERHQKILDHVGQIYAKISDLHTQLNAKSITT